MNYNTFYKKYENIILSSLTIALFGLFITVKYDLIYELNDDTVIRNLLSGTYTGTPTAMNNQMMFALSLIISLFYRIIPSVQWFDIFLIVCQYVCIWIVLKRLMEYCEKTVGKIVLSAVYLMFLFTFLLNHFVLATYTVTSGMLAVTAIFLFVTEKNNEKLFRKSIVSIVFAVLAFCIRSEMLLMLLPFICVAGVYRWAREEKIFTKENFVKYLSIFGTLMVLIGAVMATDKAAYSSDEWKDFRSFFDARTTVYDYTGIPLYDENRDFYDSNNISKEQYLLLECYDYALDENINTEMMNTIADYAQQSGDGLGDKVYKAVIAYKNQILNGFGKQYHTIIVIGYIVLALALSRNNILRILLLAAAAFFTRSVVWLYLHGQGRTPERITHPLYWAEVALLVAVYIVERKNIKINCKKVNGAVLLMIAAVCAVFFTQEYSTLGNRYNELYEKAQKYEAVHSYCIENSDNFYFTPIFSMAIYPEMVFDGSQEPTNYDLLGGWLVKSPSHKEKMNNNGINTIDTDILDKENVYIVQHSGYVSFYTEYPFQWLTGYYAGKGYDVEVIKTDTIIDNIEVYKVEKLN